MSLPVSVLLACYESQWLKEALESVVAQTVTDWELLLLDDLNSEATRAIVEEVADPRVRYLPNTTALGPALNHQRGLSELNFDLISIINHDDVWEPELLRELTVVLSDSKDEETVLSFSDHWVIRDDGSIDQEASDTCTAQFGRRNLPGGQYSGGAFYRLAVVDRAIPIAQSAVWRRRFLRRIPRWVGGAYDLYIASKLVGKDRTAVYVPERLARFRAHQGNLGLHRSPVRDVVAAGIYFAAGYGAPRDVSRHCYKMALRALANTPRSLVRRMEYYQ